MEPPKLLLIFTNVTINSVHFPRIQPFLSEDGEQRDRLPPLVQEGRAPAEVDRPVELFPFVNTVVNL